MLEIIALIFLCKKMGKLAIQKGLKPGVWKLYTVLAWIGAEMFGVLLGMTFYTQENDIKENFLGIMLIGLVSAFGGYLIIKSVLEKKPDSFDEKDINSIGTDDLRPPKRQA